MLRAHFINFPTSFPLGHPSKREKEITAKGKDASDGVRREPLEGRVKC